MARDLVDSTYYTVQSKGGKIPVKWTAPEVRFTKYQKLMRKMQDSNYIIIMQSVDFCLLLLNIFLRHSSTKSTLLTVTYGAMVWYCLRSGQLGRNHFQRFLIKRF